MFVDLSIFNNCDFTELHKYNFFDKIVFPLKDYLEWFDFGNTKLTLKFSLDNDYVYKIPFKYFIDTRNNQIKKKNMHNNICEDEITNYALLKQEGINQFFLPNIPLIQNKVYAQQLAITLKSYSEVDLSRYPTAKRKKTSQMLITHPLLKKSFIQGTNYINPIILEWFLKLSSQINLEHFLKIVTEKFDLIDFGLQNMGYLNNKSIIFDYARA